MADEKGYGIIIWNGKDLKRIESPLYHNVEGAGHVVIGNQSKDYVTGIVGMDISPELLSDKSRYLFFRPLASYDLYATDTTELKHNINNNKDVNYLEIKNALSSQAIGMAFSSEGTLFLGMTKEMAIVCWNRYKPLTSDNFVSKIHIIVFKKFSYTYFSLIF